jgi:glycerol-3-phosphate acyltransferase PlsY
MFHAWGAAKVTSAGFVPWARIWTAVVAAVITTLVTLAVKASQPASVATTLTIALGSMQTLPRDAIAIAAGVLIMAGVGEPLRYLRARSAARQASSP